MLPQRTRVGSLGSARGCGSCRFKAEFHKRQPLRSCTTIAITQRKLASLVVRSVLETGSNLSFSAEIVPSP
jgi:hypothetical protein